MNRDSGNYTLGRGTCSNCIGSVGRCASMPGVCQRMGAAKRKAEADAAAAPVPPDAGIDTWMHKLFKAGRLSASEVASGARAEQAHNARPQPSISACAKCNTFKNAYRYLMRQLVTKTTLPLEYQAEGVFWDPIKEVKYNAVINFLLPFEMLNGLVPV